MNQIHLQSNFLTPESYLKVQDYCYLASYKYGEWDNEHQIPTGVVHILELDSEIVSYFPSKIENLSLHRAYINLFNAGETPNFHVDGKGLTSLFYVNAEKYNLDEGGCTEIVTNNQYLTSILPIQNTLVTFNAELVHRATSFKTLPRFTIALKYQ